MDNHAPGPRFTSFGAFYAFYLREHSRPATRLAHVIGTLSFLGAAVASVILLHPLWCVAGIVTAYALAWLSHFLLERNRPATFRHPLYSLIADFRMAFEIPARRRPLRETAPVPEAFLDA